MHLRRAQGLLFVAFGSLLPALAACTGAESTAAGPTGPDAAVGCASVDCVDAQVPDTSTGVVDAGGFDASGDDASVDAAVDTGAPETSVPDSGDGGVIVGCVPQEVSTRYDATWVFGAGCRADWNASNQVTFSATAIHFSGFEGTISAANAFTGALFAASDGIDLYDGNGNKTSTAALGGNASATQAVAFVGKPGSASDFYIVANAASSGVTSTAGLFWSALPCGQLVPAAAPALIPGTAMFTEALATVRHANTVDRWILSSSTAGVEVLPLTAAGFGSPTATPWSAGFGAVTAMQRSFIVFARDRHTFAVTVENVGVEIGQFDNATGAVSNLTKVPMLLLPDLYSAAFSPDGSKLYVSSWSGSYYQVDLSALAADVDAGIDAGTVGSLVGNSGGALRLAIDDQIYVATYGSTALGVVTNPNAPAASLKLTTATLPTGCTSSYGFPGVGDL